MGLESNTSAVPRADAAAVEDSLPLAHRRPARMPATSSCSGSAGLRRPGTCRPVVGQGRKSRGPGIVVVPVDVRDREALFPTDTPPVVRTLIQWLREGKT
jgi:hypothetical protein